MKIVNFISGKDLGGSKQSFALYSEVFNLLGEDCVSLIKKNALIKNVLKDLHLEFKEIQYYRSYLPFMKTLAVNKIRQKLSPLKADIVFIHKSIDIMLTRLALGENVKIIAIVHSFTSKYLEYADEVIAVSNNLKEFLLSKNINKKIHIIPNMLSVQKNIKYKEIPIIPTIGSMGVFRKTKGFHILLKALSILKKRNILFQAKIAGKGKLYYYYKYLIFKYSLSKEVSLKSWVKNKNRDDFLDSLDLYILPSIKESFGMVIIEAMARGITVVATKCGGAEDIISDCENGFLVENKNPTILANTIEKIITKEIDSQHISKNAYEYVSSTYDKTIVMGQILKILRQ